MLYKIHFAQKKSIYIYEICDVIRNKLINTIYPAWRAATAVKRVAQKQRKGRLSFFIDFDIFIRHRSLQNAIRMQESRCIFVSIPFNLPIDHCNSTVSHPTFPSCVEIPPVSYSCCLSLSSRHVRAKLFTRLQLRCQQLFVLILSLRIIINKKFEKV